MKPIYSGLGSLDCDVRSRVGSDPDNEDSDKNKTKVGHNGMENVDWTSLQRLGSNSGCSKNSN